MNGKKQKYFTTIPPDFLPFLGDPEKRRNKLKVFGRNIQLTLLVGLITLSVFSPPLVEQAIWALLPKTGRPNNYILKLAINTTTKNIYLRRCHNPAVLQLDLTLQSGQDLHCSTSHSPFYPP